MRLAIADPPYPAANYAGGRKRIGSRWYGKPLGAHATADSHPDVSDWDSPESHRALIETLLTEYDGWAIATSPSGMAAYMPLRPPVRVMVWVKPNAQPGAHRLRSCWEAVLLYPPCGRRSNRGGVGQIPDVLTVPAPRNGFVGAKPPEWTRWVLAALSFDPTVDTVDDLFPGSGAVTRAVSQLQEAAA